MEAIALQSPARNLFTGLVIDHDSSLETASCRVSDNGQL